MSTVHMTPKERHERRLARAAAKTALVAIDLTGRWNASGDRYIDIAYRFAREAFRHAARSQRARERRQR